MTLEALAATIEDVLAPAHFFVAEELKLAWEYQPAETIPWELFQGRLLGRTQTRQKKIFAAWNVHVVEGGQRSAEPLLSVKHDAEVGEIHVTRGLLCHVWEGYDSGGGVYLSRETTRWTRELVGTIRLMEVPDVDELRVELTQLLFRAVIGTSRLPLTSLEAPLPDFTLGRLAYFYCSEVRGAEPTRSPRQLFERVHRVGISWLEEVKLLEVWLRAQAHGLLPVGFSQENLPALLRTLFNEVSLSPWTDLVPRILEFVRQLVSAEQLTPEQQIDFLGYLLRQTARHLTAYDLVNFHHNGANYPDALLLDLVLKEYLRLIETCPELCADPDRGRLRRRALRQGWLLRRHYEGHLVPDAPTSPGENARVLPPPHRRVPEEQILSSTRRNRRLYDNDPLTNYLGEQGRQLLRASARDLDHPDELRELGMAVFIDRPLGVFKAPAEPDQTVLLSYEAFSRAVAERRLEELARDPALGMDAAEVEKHRHALGERPIAVGLPLARVGRESRPVVSLNDARRVSEDFLLLRTLPQGVRDFLTQYPLGIWAKRFDLSYLTGSEPVLLVRDEARRSSAGAPTGSLLAIYDAEMRKRLELEICAQQGYVCRRGVEQPAGGLRVRRVWEPSSHGELEEHLPGSEKSHLLGSLVATLDAKS